MNYTQFKRYLKHSVLWMFAPMPKHMKEWCRGGMKIAEPIK